MHHLNREKNIAMLKIKYILAIALTLAILFSSCEEEQNETLRETENLEKLYQKNQSKISIKQGVAGTLVLKEGNCMPMIGPYEGDNPCRNYAVRRTIQVYEPTSPEDAEGRGPSFEKIHTNLIAETETDEEGFFQLGLDTGRYSLFIIEKGKYYRNMWSDSFIGPVSIEADSVTIENPVIDYAVY
jgi:hypothetical protein